MAQLPPEEGRLSRHDAPRRAALRIAAVYLVVCVAWIVGSDAAVEAFLDPALAARVQTVKGVIFVALSAAVIFWLVSRELRLVREEQHRAGLLVEQGLAGVFVVQDGRFLQANARLATLLGYAAGELDGLALADVVAEEDRAEVLERVREVARGADGATLRHRFTGVRADGSRIRLEAHGGRITRRGTPATLGIVLDVTEREALEGQAMRAQRLEALGRLTGAVAHDFNNVLTALVTPLDLALHELDADHPVRHDLVEARATAERAVTFSRQLLAFSRRRVYRPRPVDLAAVVREMEPLMRRLMGARGRLELDDVNGEEVVEIDPARFEQVIMNLVVNAREAAGEGGRVWVRLGAQPERDGRCVFLEVEDDGPGIAPEARDRLFEPFFTTKPGGTGLGLATVHGIVTQAGGRLEVRSEPGRGATFRVLLPASPRPAEKTGASAREVRVDAPAAGHGERILVVEDQAPVRRVTVRVLTRFGYRVSEASDAAGALARFQEEPALRLVITDMGLPDMDGTELAERMRRLHPGLPVIFTSGHQDPGVMQRLAGDRAALFLEKPYSVEGLLGAVHAVLHPGPRAQDEAGQG